jgi:hypothetical protein
VFAIVVIESAEEPPIKLPYVPRPVGIGACGVTTKIDRMVMDLNIVVIAAIALVRVSCDAGERPSGNVQIRCVNMSWLIVCSFLCSINDINTIDFDYLHMDSLLPLWSQCLLATLNMGARKGRVG